MLSYFVVVISFAFSFFYIYIYAQRSSAGITARQTSLFFLVVKYAENFSFSVLVLVASASRPYR